MTFLSHFKQSLQVQIILLTYETYAFQITNIREDVMCER